MPFAPHEIENKKFVVALRGYQTDEVEGFLRAVASDYRALLKESHDSAPERWMDHIERIMSSVRAEAEREAFEIRAVAERDAAELKEATALEAEACFAEIARQAAELHRLEQALWARMHALEHCVVEARQALSHAADLYPIGTESTNGDAYGDRVNLAAETNVAAAIAARYEASTSDELSMRMTDGPTRELVQFELQ
jgi:DivIVA domain-containing protein